MVIYQRTKSLEYASEKMKGELQEAPTTLTVPADDATEEEKKKYQEDRNNEIRVFKTIQIRKAEQFIDEAPAYKYNVNIYNNNSNLVPSADFESEKLNIDNLGKFLVES